jgi:hypothetical protein
VRANAAGFAVYPVNGINNPIFMLASLPQSRPHRSASSAPARLFAIGANPI